MNGDSQERVAVAATTGAALKCGERGVSTNAKLLVDRLTAWSGWILRQNPRECQGNAAISA